MEAMLDFVRYPLAGTGDQFVNYSNNVDLPDAAAFSIDTIESAETQSQDSHVMMLDVGWGRIAIPEKVWDPLSSVRIESTFDFYPVDDGYAMALDRIEILSGDGSEIEILREVNPELYPGFGSDSMWNSIVDSTGVGTVSDEGWMAEYVPAHEDGLHSTSHAFRVRVSASAGDTQQTDMLQWVVDHSTFHFEWQPGSATVK
jgi:hypothetical protein